MRTLPGKRRFPRFEKSIDDDRVTLRNGSSRHARGLTIDDRWSAIDRGAGCIRKYHVAAIRNSLWIDRAMSRAQTRTVGRCAQLTFAPPINGNPRKERIVGRENRGREQRSKANR